jgi:multidrug efflux pump subunit AcrB/ABC-type multidrug transport system ATPase subunit
MNWTRLPVRRPVATAMFFTAIVLLGIIGWQKIPVELLPDLEGDELYVSFSRPNSEPEVVEREILIPLEERAAGLHGIAESWGEVSGSRGMFTVRFEPGSDIKIRQLELERMADDLTRDQPRGTFIEVRAEDITLETRFVMLVRVMGGDDNNTLRSLVDERIEARLAAVTGVGNVWVFGGQSEEISVTIDTDRCAALGVDPSDVSNALSRSIRRLRFVGGLEDNAGRTAVMLDGRPRGVFAIAETRISMDKPVLLRHVADVTRGGERQDRIFRINSEPSVALIVFQEEGANLVALGRELRSRLEDLRKEFRPYGIDFVIGYDAADVVEDQIDRLKKLGVSGFVVALVILFLFLRQARAVCVVAVAVPVSLLLALAMLFVGDFTLNIITLFGLAVGIGMLVDNSIVVYEAVQRRLERGASPDQAAAEGVGRTIRAIVAATATTAIVFLPAMFLVEDTMTRGLLRVLAVAILLPLISSLLVAVGLVPLLARRLAAPAALARIRALRQRRELYAGLVFPDRGRELFSGVLKVALRRPALWLTVVAASVLLTVIVAVPWVGVSTVSREASQADEVRLLVDVPSGKSLEAVGKDAAVLEQAALELEGVTYVESAIEEGSATLTVKFADPDERPEDLTVSRVRAKVREAADTLRGYSVRSEESAGGGDSGGGLMALLGQGAAEIALSGPDADQLIALGEAIRERLESISEIGEHGVWISTESGQDEIHVTADQSMLTGLGLMPDQVLSLLNVLGREGSTMPTGLIQADGREIPLTVRSTKSGYARLNRGIGQLRISTAAGIIPLGLVANIRKMPSPTKIAHHNGRRELSVYYRFNDSAPSTGLARQALDEKVRSMLREIHRPAGYTIELPDEEKATGWFKRLLVPMVLMLFAVLAITFESLTLPVLVLLTVPLTLMGAVWALVLAGMPAGMMALAGAVALLGLTVNPAILLVDRMQQRALRHSWTAGAAALAAVRERTRPILMTTCTTIAGLWPLALATGRENEIWPPFAVVVMGGLAASSLLTLLVIPVGFVFLSRLDRLFGRLGTWVVLVWLGATAAVTAPLFITGQITSMTWQTITTMGVAALFLGIAVLVFRRTDLPEPDSSQGPPTVDVRYLCKVYGRPGPVGRAWRLGEHFAERVLALGGKPFVPADARRAVVPLAVLLGGTCYLAFFVSSMWWKLVFSFVAAVMVNRVLVQIRRLRGKVDPLGRALPGGVEGLLAFLTPWIILILLVSFYYFLPRFEARAVRLPMVAAGLAAAIIALVQFGRRTARRISAGAILQRVAAGHLRRSRTLWRKLSRRIFGLDLPRDEVEALKNIHFTARQGMVGVLGPNGAGKTTLLRMLAGILEPSLGTIHLGGVSIRRIARYLARWMGYLPQDFGLPKDLTGREYLEYYALLYDIGTGDEGRKRVDLLLEEVGLSGQADKKIGGYSGGMRQRVAVARTLLRLPSVIIVDEPTVGLDPRERIRFRNLLAQLSKTRVVLFSTHVVEDVAVACDRVIVLARGEKVFDGEPSRLAREAEGWVWELRLKTGAEKTLPEESLVVDQVPEADGFSRARVLCKTPPLEGAKQVAPNLQDGYLRLVGYRAAR